MLWLKVVRNQCALIGPEVVHVETGKCYAAKVIRKRMIVGREHMVRNEIAILQKISVGHGSILTLIDYFETPNSCASQDDSRLNYSVPYYRFVSRRRTV